MPVDHRLLVTMCPIRHDRPNLGLRKPFHSFVSGAVDLEPKCEARPTTDSDLVLSKFRQTRAKPKVGCVGSISSTACYGGMGFPRRNILRLPEKLRRPRGKVTGKSTTQDARHTTGPISARVKALRSRQGCSHVALLGFSNAFQLGAIKRRNPPRKIRGQDRGSVRLDGASLPSFCLHPLRCTA